ncbi:hypothetical protein BHM03_00051132 [Ensete ventricosum]|nr:hypothetical protein BHM03_00051132 [Ensete ventricosum]
MVASGRSKGRRRAWLRQRRLRQREEKAAGSGEEEEVGEQRRFGNSPGVRQEFAEGIGSLLGWRKGVHWKKTETRRKIVGGLTTTGAIELQPDDGPRSSLGIRPGSDDAAGPRREFTRRFAKGIGKLAWNTPGERRKKTRRLAARMPEAVGLAGIPVGKPPVSGDWTARTLEIGWLPTAEPPRSAAKLPVLGFRAANNG